MGWGRTRVRSVRQRVAWRREGAPDRAPPDPTDICSSRPSGGPAPSASWAAATKKAVEATGAGGGRRSVREGAAGACRPDWVGRLRLTPVRCARGVARLGAATVRAATPRAESAAPGPCKPGPIHPLASCPARLMCSAHRWRHTPRGPRVGTELWHDQHGRADPALVPRAAPTTAQGSRRGRRAATPPPAPCARRAHDGARRRRRRRHRRRRQRQRTPAPARPG